VKPEDLLNLPRYHAYARLLIDGMPSKPFSMRTLPPPRSGRWDGNRADIIRRYCLDPRALRLPLRLDGLRLRSLRSLRLRPSACAEGSACLLPYLPPEPSTVSNATPTRKAATFVWTSSRTTRASRPGPAAALGQGGRRLPGRHRTRPDAASHELHAQRVLEVLFRLGRFGGRFWRALGRLAVIRRRVHDAVRRPELPETLCQLPPRLTRCEAALGSFGSPGMMYRHYNLGLRLARVPVG
jgi:hypothetical protein